MNNSTPLWQVQVAIRTKLVADATLMDKVAGIYDHVPETAAMPYITVGEAIQTPDNTHDTFGHQTVVTLHVWTKERSFNQATDLAADLLRILDRQPLTITGRHTVDIKYEFSQTLRDPNPEVRHIPVRFRVTTQETP